MAEITNENYGELIAALDSEKKCRFYESFAFELTIASRLWSEPKLGCEEIVDQLKWLNEIQHRVVAKIRHIQTSTDSWPEEQFISMVAGYVEQNRAIGGAVTYAIKKSYDFVVIS